MSKAYHTSGADNMLAKVQLLVLWATCGALAEAAPGIYDGYGGYGGYHGGYGVGVGLAPAYGHAVAQPIIAKQVLQAEPIDPNPAYSFSYGVSDPHTGDQKDASESLQNGVVHGAYSLVEPDGHLRKVTYTADKINGFNAIVERTGGAGPVIAAPVAKYAVAPAPYAVAAPVAKIGLNPWG